RQLKLEFRLVAARHILSREMAEEREAVLVSTVPYRLLRLLVGREEIEIAPHPLGGLLGGVVDEGLFLARPAVPHGDGTGRATVQCPEHRKLVVARGEIMRKSEGRHSSPIAPPAARRPRPSPEAATPCRPAS